MNIYFVETEQAEQEYFASKLGGHQLHFMERLIMWKTMPKFSPRSFIRRSTAHFSIRIQRSNSSQRAPPATTTSTLPSAAGEAVVSSVGSYGENTVAEHTFALILALSRKLRESLAANRNEKFSYEAIRGFDLKRKTLGVVGSGRVGLHAIRMARAFDMSVIGYDTQPQWFMAEILGFEYVTLDDLLRCSDIITLHLPLLPSTQHSLNREAFAKCKRGALVINTARGGLIDTDALLEAWTAVSSPVPESTCWRKSACSNRNR